MMTIRLPLLVSLLMAVAVLSHPKSSKNRSVPEKEILSQDEIERTVRRIEEGSNDESAELIHIEEKQEVHGRILTMTSHKRNIKLDLRPAHGLIRPDVRVVVMDNDGERETDLPASVRFGLYRGAVTGSHKGVAALMKNEEGWHGLVSTEGEQFHLHGLKRSSRSLMVPFEADSEDYILEDDMMELEEEREDYNLTNDEMFKRDASPELKLELGITTDFDVYRLLEKKYPDSDPETKVKEMVLNTVNGMQAHYSASNMDYKINFEIAVLRILKKIPEKILAKDVDYFPYKYFCNWDYTNNNPGLANYDIAIFFTGTNKNLLGLATVSHTCRWSGSCAMGRMTDYRSPITMSHEVGHNLGAPHDNDVGCPYGYVMWSSISKGGNSFSSCSNQRITNYIKGLDAKGINCMRKDTESSIKLCPTTLLPGKNLKLNEQCEIIYGKGMWEVRTGGGYCASLFCRQAYWGEWPYIGPPLPGSRCGTLFERKICWQDQCLDEDIVYEKIKKLNEGRKPGASFCPLPDNDHPPNPCGVGWDNRGDSCYRVLSQKGTKNQGKAACQALGGGSTLASITSQEEADFVKKYKFVGFYIGLKDDSYTTVEGPDAKRNWKWEDGSPYSFTLWESGEPNNYGGFEKCVTVNRGVDWNDVPCSTVLSPLCEKPVVPPPPPASTPAPVNPCGEDWKHYGDYCYQLLTEIRTEKEGETACQNLDVEGGSHLTSIHNREEADFIRVVFRGKTFYIGLEDKSYTTVQGPEAKREWQWTDGSPYEYNAWVEGQPSNNKGSEKCTIAIGAHRWNDVSCGRKFPSLCKKPVVPPAPTAPTPPPVNPCGEGWKEYKGFCYQMTEKKWKQPDGEAACRALGDKTELASVLSRDELDFLRAMFKSTKKFYIGLKDEGDTDKSDWKWSDGSPYEYSVWVNEEEPNNKGEPKKCVYMNKRFLWANVPCTKKLPSLCKKPVE